MPTASEPTHTSPQPADRFPLREYDLTLNDLTGWTLAEVLTKLGQPDSRSMGNHWIGPDHITYVRQANGKIIPLHVFGVVPRKIPVGDRYEEWVYVCLRSKPASARAFL